MTANPPAGSHSSGPGVSLRQFLGGAAALAAGLAIPAVPGVADAREAQGSGAPSRRPNLVILMTDQERYPQHWPEGWADEHLPNRRRLSRHGLTFRRAFCASAMCSPSRASIFTGVYPSEHGVMEVLQYGTDTVDQATLQPSRQNMAKLLKSAGYDVQYRGKWLISKDRAARSPSRAGATSRTTASGAGFRRTPVGTRRRPCSAAGTPTTTP
jgi:choline-sulfatase